MKTAEGKTKMPLTFNCIKDGYELEAYLLIYTSERRSKRLCSANPILERCVCLDIDTRADPILERCVCVCVCVDMNTKV